MGLFSIFKKKNKIKNQDLSKKYLSIGDKRYDEQDMLNQIELYEIFKKYRGYEKIIDISNGDIVYDKVNSLMFELLDNKFLCKNYDEFDDLYNNFKEFPVYKVSGLNILECMVLITAIERSNHWSGTLSNFYLGYTKNDLIPQIVYRIISLYESISLV